MSIRRINLFAGPSAGKSTTAHYLVSRFKADGINAELAAEYVKSWAYINRKPKGLDQIYISAKQFHYEERNLAAGVDILISDSPVLLGVVYSEFYQCPQKVLETVDKMSDALDEKYGKGHNIFLNRHKDKVYKKEGRYQNIEESLEIDKLIFDRVTKKYGRFDRKFVDFPNRENLEKLYLDIRGDV